MDDLYKTLIFSGDFARILSTPSLRQLRLRLMGAQQGSTNPKLSFLFGHQSNLHPFVSLFNLTDTSCLS